MKYLLFLLLMVGCTVSEPVAPGTISTPAMAQAVFCVSTLTSQSVNIRELPDINARVTGRLPNETVATVVRIDGQWYQITINTAIVGYVASWVVQEVDCFDSETDQLIQSECFDQVMSNPDVFVKGGYDWSADLIDNNKVAQLYQLILSHIQGEHQDTLYIQFTESQDELFQIFPEQKDNYTLMGAYGWAVLSNKCSLRPQDGTSEPVPVIVAFVSSNSIDFAEDFDTLVHELTHATGTGHGNWSDNAYFWGVLGQMAATSNCNLLDADVPERGICDEMNAIIYDS